LSASTPRSIPSLTSYDNWNPFSKSWRIQRLYLAGPMRGHDRYNFPAFLEATKDLRSRGFTVWSPAEHDLENGFDPTTPEEELGGLAQFMMADLPRVCESDAIVLLPGWRKSTGARLEAHVATVCEIPLYSYPSMKRVYTNVVGSDDNGHDGPEDSLKSDYVFDFSDLKPGHYRLFPHQHAFIESLDNTDEKAAEVVDRIMTAAVRDAERARQKESSFLNGTGVLGPDLGLKHIVTNQVTGGQKETRPARFDLLPWDQLWKVAELYAYGATKYEDRNWEKGYDFSLSIAALHRHLAKFVQGESFDTESGQHHLASVVFHALALMRFESDIRHGKLPDELDNRPDAPIVNWPVAA